MDKQHSNFTATEKGQGVSITACDAPLSPVDQAMKSLRQEISETHLQAEKLIHSVDYALSDEALDAVPPNLGRTRMPSNLAEDIQSLADELRHARIKLSSARERVTL